MKLFGIFTGYRVLPFLVFLLFLNTLQAQKRGIAYGHHSVDDLAVMAPEISWWYNWAVQPENGLDSTYEAYGYDFVPMAWNGSFDEDRLRLFLDAHPDTRFLLGFNEPNFKAQANMTPSQAAAQWPRLEAIADEYGLLLVGPAVNFCGNCVQENGTIYSDPVRYLDDFFAACATCRVDYIAVHSYMNNVGALAWYIDLFKKYEKPIWLTEFAGWEPNGTIQSPGDQVNYMIGAVDFLESDTSVFRYAWFIGRGPGIDQYPFLDILGENGTLTPLGTIYKNMPVHDPFQVVTVPGIIEAEAYNTMSGILLEKTADVSGFINVGYIDPGDWLEYRIHALESGYYPIRFRVASTKNASMRVLLDGEATFTLQIPNFNGWQNWNDLEAQIYLEEGIHVIRLEAITSGFNLNWFSIEALVNAMEAGVQQEDQMVIYPNPATKSFHIRTLQHIQQLLVHDVNGRLVRTLSSANTEYSLCLPPGLYFVSGLDSKGVFSAVKAVLIKAD